MEGEDKGWTSIRQGMREHASNVERRGTSAGIAQRTRGLTSEHWCRRCWRKTKESVRGPYRGARDQEGERTRGCLIRSMKIAASLSKRPKQKNFSKNFY